MKKILIWFFICLLLVLPVAAVNFDVELLTPIYRHINNGERADISMRVTNNNVLCSMSCNIAGNRMQLQAGRSESLSTQFSAPAEGHGTHEGAAWAECTDLCNNEKEKKSIHYSIDWGIECQRPVFISSAPSGMIDPRMTRFTVSYSANCVEDAVLNLAEGEMCNLPNRERYVMRWCNPGDPQYCYIDVDMTNRRGKFCYFFFVNGPVGGGGSLGTPERVIEVRSLSVCGNGIIEQGELCDGNNLNGRTCQSVGRSGGQLACAAGCSSFNYAGCFTCGNGACESNKGENAQNCNQDCQAAASIGVDITIDGHKRVKMTAPATFTLSWQTINSPAICIASGNWDGRKSPSGSQTFSDVLVLGLKRYTLACSNEDRSVGSLDTAYVEIVSDMQPPPIIEPPVERPMCGNYILEGNEECEGTQFKGKTCENLGFSGGRLRCEGCKMDSAGCYACGNSVCEERKGENKDNCKQDCEEKVKLQCETDNGCNENEHCVKNKCIPFECPTRFYVKNHECVRKEESECSVDLDCNDNQVCDSKVCKDAFTLVVIPLGFSEDEELEYNFFARPNVWFFKQHSPLRELKPEKERLRVHYIPPAICDKHTSCTRTPDDVEICRNEVNNCARRSGLKSAADKIIGIKNGDLHYEDLSLCGFALSIGDDISINSDSCFVDVIAHEIGHQFGLYHISSTGKEAGACQGPNAQDCEDKQFKTDIMGYNWLTNHYGPMAYKYLKRNYFEKYLSGD